MTTRLTRDKVGVHDYSFADFSYKDSDIPNEYSNDIIDCKNNKVTIYCCNYLNKTYLKLSTNKYMQNDNIDESHDPNEVHQFLSKVLETNNSDKNDSSQASVPDEFPLNIVISNQYRNTVCYNSVR